MGTKLEEALALALKLAPKERLQLIEQVASSVEQEIEATSAENQPPEQHWGRNLLRLLDELGPIEFVDSEIEDPVEWVKTQRRKRDEQLKPYRDGDQ